jgi:hypothetical protein
MVNHMMNILKNSRNKDLGYQQRIALLVIGQEKNAPPVSRILIRQFFISLLTMEVYLNEGVKTKPGRV